MIKVDYIHKLKVICNEMSQYICNVFREKGVVAYIIPEDYHLSYMNDFGESEEFNFVYAYNGNVYGGNVTVGLKKFFNQHDVVPVEKNDAFDVAMWEEDDDFFDVRFDPMDIADTLSVIIDVINTTLFDKDINENAK